jgi:hypothetical protein
MLDNFDIIQAEPRHLQKGTMTSKVPAVSEPKRHPLDSLSDRHKEQKYELGSSRL